VIGPLPMAVEETQRESESWWDRITRDLALSFATTMGALYAVGLLIVNLDLGRFGVVAVDLARPEYIMVGLLWAILVTLTIAMIWFVFLFVSDVMRRNASSWAAFLVVVMVVFVALAFYLLVLMIVCGDIDLDNLFHPWFLKLVMGLAIQAGLILLLKVVSSVLIKGQGKSILVAVSPPPEEYESWRMLALLLAMGASVSVGLLGLLLYTTFVFPQIPREWGGGDKAVVDLFLTDKLPVFTSRKDIFPTTDGRRIGPVLCILETDRMLIIAPLNYSQRTNNHRETIAIDRKLVIAVVYEGSRFGFGGSDSDQSEISNNRPTTSPSPLAASPNPTSSPPVAH
jgi:hypothetical protein